MISQLLTIGAGEIILIAACAAVVIGVIVAAIVRKKKGKPSCGCDCANCSFKCQNSSPKNKSK